MIRVERRYVDRLYRNRDREIAAIDHEIAALRRERSRANNSLAGAKYAAGIDTRMGKLQRARSGVVAS